jgi:hypothetical protein
MSRRRSSNEIAARSAPIIAFVGRVSELLQRIDLLSTTVERCAKEAPEINELIRQRDQRQTEFEDALALAAESRQDVDSIVRLRDDLNAEIECRYRPFLDVDKEVRRFVSSVGEILDYLPANRPELQPIRFEIERLALWQMVANPFTIPMGKALGELKKVKMRFLEVLDECNRQQAKPSGGSSREDRRRQIVDDLQAKLHLKSREKLAEYLRVDDSAIRAAIRGDLNHSGPAAEEKLLEACLTHNVDINGWST